MRNLPRYLLVGLLMSGMTLDATAANRWIDNACCSPPNLEFCPPVQCCPPGECCHEEIVVFESQADCCVPSADQSFSESLYPAPIIGDSFSHEMIAPPEANPAFPSQELEQPESSVVNEPDIFEADVTEISPPPVSVPQPPAEDIAAPAVDTTTPEPEADSLFDAPTTSSLDPIPEESPADEVPSADLFDEPAVEDPIVAEDAPAEIEPLDNEFPTPEEEPETESPADSAPEDTEESEAPSLDDLFGQHQAQPVLNEPGGLASHAVRRWTDDGARFHCDARLQQVTAKTVILLKDNGKRIAVLFSRLSEVDLQFIQRQVVAQRQLLAQPAVGQQLASH